MDFRNYVREKALRCNAYWKKICYCSWAKLLTFFQRNSVQKISCNSVNKQSLEQFWKESLHNILQFMYRERLESGEHYKYQQFYQLPFPIQTLHKYKK